MRSFALKLVTKLMTKLSLLAPLRAPLRLLAAVQIGLLDREAVGHFPSSTLTHLVLVVWIFVHHMVLAKRRSQSK
jgi:hypothetical protein